MKVVALVLGGLALAAGGVGAGFVLDGEPHTATEELAATGIGDPKRGRVLFTDYGCVACHSYAGRGGKDAPPLDHMRGRLSASAVANMAGKVWNHAPAMREFFREEGIPFPNFKGDDMADLVAYLHGGGAAPRMMRMHEEAGQGETMHDGDEK